MRGFDEETAQELGSEGRFHSRIEKFRESGARRPAMQHYCWWLIHNLAAHGFIALIPCRWSFGFHDWTSRKLNAE